jgi:hypothetical protein
MAYDLWLGQTPHNWSRDGSPLPPKQLLFSSGLVIGFAIQAVMGVLRKHEIIREQKYYRGIRDPLLATTLRLPSIKD